MSFQRAVGEADERSMGPRVWFGYSHQAVVLCFSGFERNSLKG